MQFPIRLALCPYQAQSDFTLIDLLDCSSVIALLGVIFLPIDYRAEKRSPLQMYKQSTWRYFAVPAS
jgi:hypothetical protein